MTVLRDSERGAIGLAERILALLDEGRFSATYKFAVLAGLMDLCMENTTRHGAAPDVVTTRQAAAKIIELYWPQTATYEVGANHRMAVLRQGGNTDDEQAEIVSRIASFRAALSADPFCPIERARRSAPEEWRQLLDFVEWKLIEYPLPRVQRVGKARDEFLYSIGWDENIKKSTITRYQLDDPGEFDNRIHLQPGVGDALVRLHGLLRPLLHRKWAQKIAELNRLDEARLESFLFGVERVSLEPVRDDLVALHEGRCFYCDDRLGAAAGRRVQIDHFVPWARHPDNAVENLVPAHERCNSQKRDFLAATDHVRRWRDRVDRCTGDLRLIAERARFEHNPERVLSVARGIYVRLPTGAQLWVRGDQFEPAETQCIDGLFDSGPSPALAG